MYRILTVVLLNTFLLTAEGNICENTIRKTNFSFTEKLEAKFRSELFITSLRANVKFPQMTTGIVLSMVAKFLTKPYFIKTYEQELTVKEKQKAYRAMLAMHKKHGITVKVPIDRVVQIFPEHRYEATLIIGSIIRHLIGRRLHSAHVYESFNFLAKDAKSDSYFRDMKLIGEIMQETLNSERVVLAAREHRENLEKFPGSGRHRGFKRVVEEVLFENLSEVFGEVQARRLLSDYHFERLFGKAPPSL